MAKKQKRRKRTKIETMNLLTVTIQGKEHALHFGGGGRLRSLNLSGNYVNIDGAENVRGLLVRGISIYVEGDLLVVEGNRLNPNPARRPS